VTEYQPGACNIGHAERRRRYLTGVAGFAAAALLVAAVATVHADRAWLLAAVAPLFVGFLGVLQARARFCVGFAMAGVFDVSASGERRQPAPEAGQRADRKRAIVLSVKALAAATVGALALYLAAGALA
jgi:MFS family permease